MAVNYSSLSPNAYDGTGTKLDKILLVLILIATNGAGSGGGSVGVGSPEGVVTAVPGITYLDSSTNSLWYKRTGVGNTGWIQLIA